MKKLLGAMTVVAVLGISCATNRAVEPATGGSQPADGATTDQGSTGGSGLIPAPVDEASDADAVPPGQPGDKENVPSGT